MIFYIRNSQKSDCPHFTIPRSTSLYLALVNLGLPTAVLRSLTKRYQNKNWEEERRKRTSDEIRRSARLRYLRQIRETYILTNPELWRLANVVPPACSDDETDLEQISTPSQQGPVIPCVIRSVKWRSNNLKTICMLLDLAKSKVDSSKPRKKGASPRQSGRPNRPRYRCIGGPQSQVPAPSGLPVDCYSSTWLQKLSPLERTQLEVNPVPILDELLPLVEKL
ncbi:uncharacterized protein MELLADRAFT_111817 [Melampsora larici-populina 98AG31]|uniref:Uncharacterized protein n=1 Tax=Melampsora larici-populina (strain 98AG31 / pathotype 3-4-7) TaxID=747676 RepID=F4S4G1_MELLP|nr:uncharacterized protein MELLADRAFT_111817 [Melampsora larici-populina 98AG31]EGG00406.1 hypothetical protein MELLADRAFT_111817 [Melampsora larici-populina 98AG31]